MTLPQDFGDRFSPVVVKELRQGLRTHLFTAAMVLFHGFVVLLLGSVLMEAPIQDVTRIFWGAAGVMLLVLQPLRAFNALHSEASSGTLDMLTLTSISVFRILYGKWLALFSQSLLVAGSLLPYMVARYQFGGVEIVREAVALVVLVLGSGVVTAAVLAFSSQPSVLLRLALTAGIGFCAFPLGYFIHFLVTSAEADQMLRRFGELEMWQRWGIVAGVLALCFYTMWYFLALGASRIAPDSENHSTRKRVIVMVAHAALMILGLLICRLSTDVQDASLVMISLLFLTLFVCMDVLTEEMPRSPMSLAGLAGHGGSGRLAGRLLHPGWASGVFFSSVLCLMTMALLVTFEHRRGYGNWSNGPSLHFFCLLLAVFVPVLIRWKGSRIFANWWVVQICMVVLGVLVGKLTVVVGSNFGWLGVVAPVTMLFGVNEMEYDRRFWALQAGAVVSLLWLGAAMLRAWRHFGEYTKLEAAVPLLPQTSATLSP